MINFLLFDLRIWYEEDQFCLIFVGYNININVPTEQTWDCPGEVLAVDSIQWIQTKPMSSTSIVADKGIKEVVLSLAINLGKVGATPFTPLLKIFND